VTRGALAALALGAALWAAPVAAQTWQTVTSARQLHGESALSVDVTYVAGRFELHPAAPGDLYQMELRYDADKFRPVRQYDASAGLLRVGLESKGNNVSYTGERDSRQVQSLTLALTRDVPLDLEITMGAAEADVELGGLALRRLEYKTGASKTDVRFSRPNPVTCSELSFDVGAAQFEATGLGNVNCRRMRFEGGVGKVTLDFTGDWRSSADVEVHVALGTVTLRLPRELGVTISLDRFLASFDQTGFTKRGDVWYSDNYATARRHLRVHAESAFGGIQVVWTGGSP
jgi:hypothetical protein